ncbi:hypothetical protein P1X14_03805 [Sphingomonas sp. AOB5]|uniref:hypothetical protein n=1 Tax=Sphingomonas sp. AOB5 TaxID=3034017 RepID=UPI0023F7C9EA|nr:hypothetical protein [Sphingomonas sp. AOB5]MDF7774360.1 hypothetical protein [Sphingomonas sp. AOB5]
MAADRDYPWLDFSLCKTNDAQISVLAAPAMQQAGVPVSISVTQLQDGKDWKPAFRALHDRLEARWPGATRYQDAMGQAISEPPNWLVNPAPSSTVR